MLTRIKIKNFKRFDEVEFELGQNVVLIGPNNSGKTTALQALALWDIGLRRWLEKRGSGAAGQRPGVTVNRRDLVSIPIPETNLLWRNLHVRSMNRSGTGRSTQNVNIEITVEGVSEGKLWTCGLEFDYANNETFYCRPLRTNGTARMPIPREVENLRFAYLPPMSGLADREFVKQAGEMDFLIGQGQTAQVLRNLCWDLSQNDPESWATMNEEIRTLFGIELRPPLLIPERGEITMAYQQPGGKELDISSSGRGLQQTLLLLSYLYSNSRAVLLLDEPDAHLEVLRQHQIYRKITEVAARQNSQIIAASHSEVVLNEAAGHDVVVAFVGKPHRIDGRTSQVLKSLTDLGFDQYYQAEQKGWVLYLEGSTDLSILQTFARTLKHPAEKVMETPFVHYVGTNIPEKAREHFYGLREAKPDLVGIAIFDHITKPLQKNTPLVELMWSRRELENYLTTPQVLMAYAVAELEPDLFGYAESEKRCSAMEESIQKITDALKTLDLPGPWSAEIKASDDFLDRLFKAYFEKLGLPDLLRKSGYHTLAGLIPAEQIDWEIIEKLDGIVEVAHSAKSMEE